MNTVLICTSTSFRIHFNVDDGSFVFTMLMGDGTIVSKIMSSVDSMMLINGMNAAMEAWVQNREAVVRTQLSKELG